MNIFNITIYNFDRDMSIINEHLCVLHIDLYIINEIQIDIHKYIFIYNVQN